jgi:hypothetical protein
MRDGFAIAPKVLDASSVVRQFRSVSAVIGRYVGICRNVPLSEPLRAEYKDERGSVAIDSNMLLLLTAHDYYTLTGARNWWKRRLKDLVQLYRYYDHLKDADGLIVQPPFSDWQDSVRRTGKTFYTNLLYYLVSKRLAGFSEFRITPGKVDQLRSAIEDRFYDKDLGIYRSIASTKAACPQFSVDANLLAIDLGYFDDDPDRAKSVYASLRESCLWRGRADLPGYVTSPNYPGDWIHWIVRLARLPHYHDEMYWSWLIALAAKIAWKMNDYGQAARIVDRLADIAKRDQSIVEIYSPTPDLEPFSSWLYNAERPFSWGAAFVLDLVGEITGKLVRPTKHKGDQFLTAR